MRWNPWNLWDSGIRRNAMSGRRRFGSVVSRTSRDGKRRYVEARYQPPVWAYAKWPDLPKHYSRRFDADYTAMAEAWLADVERHIRLGDWEPPRIVVSKTRATAGTSSGLSSPAMTADGHASITLRSILKRAAWVLAHFWPGMRSRRFAHSGCRRLPSAYMRTTRPATTSGSSRALQSETTWSIASFPCKVSTRNPAFAVGHSLVSLPHAHFMSTIC